MHVDAPSASHDQEMPQIIKSVDMLSKLLQRINRPFHLVGGTVLAKNGTGFSWGGKMLASDSNSIRLAFVQAAKYH